MSGDHSSSADVDGFDRVTASDDRADLVDGGLDQFGSALVSQSSDDVEASRQIAVKGEREPFDGVSPKYDWSTSVVEDNVFKSAFDVAVSVKSDVAFAEGLAGMIHGNRFSSLGGDCSDAAAAESIA